MRKENQKPLMKKILYVPDYVINAGGLMNVANELTGYDSKKQLIKLKVFMKHY